MNENDFYVAIQAILEKALENGWPLERVESYGVHAVEEFVEAIQDEREINNE